MTLQRAEGPRDVIACRGTARSYGVQRNRAIPRGAEDRATLCGAETAHSYGVPKDRATLRGAEGPRAVTWCRGTTRRYRVQRNRA